MCEPPAYSAVFSPNVVLMTVTTLSSKHDTPPPELKAALPEKTQAVTVASLERSRTWRASLCDCVLVCVPACVSMCVCQCECVCVSMYVCVSVCEGVFACLSVCVYVTGCLVREIESVCACDS